MSGRLRSRVRTEAEAWAAERERVAAREARRTAMRLRGNRLGAFERIVWDAWSWLITWL